MVHIIYQTASTHTGCPQPLLHLWVLDKIRFCFSTDRLTRLASALVWNWTCTNTYKIMPKIGISSTGMIHAILKLESIGRFKIAMTTDELTST